MGKHINGIIPYLCIIKLRKPQIKQKSVFMRFSLSLLVVGLK